MSNEGDRERAIATARDKFKKLIIEVGDIVPTEDWEYASYWEQIQVYRRALIFIAKLELKGE